MPLPDIRGRVQILTHHMRNIKVGPGEKDSTSRSPASTDKYTLDADTMILARGTSGFSGADLQNMVK